MAEVLLVNSSISYGGIARGINHYPPMGLCYLAASLRKEGIESIVIDLGIEMLDIGNIIKTIRKNGTKIIGVSAKTPQVHNAIRIIRGIRKYFGDSITIVLGGYHISNDPIFLERYPEIDFGMIGDGDITFPKLVRRVLDGERLKGVFYGEMINSLDEVPLPAYDLVNLSNYRKMGMDAYPILGTRGCPFDCVFCSRAPMSRKVRYRSTENIMGEMDKYYDDFNGRFEFQDESFTLKKSNIINLCESIIKWERKVYWSAGGVRLDQIDYDLAELMWSAGCRTFFVGIESGSERVRNEIVGKHITDSQIFRSFRILDHFNFEVEISFVLGHPTETEDELKQSVYFPSRLKNMGIRCITQIGLKPAVPMPGSRLWNIALQEGKISSDLVDRYIRFELGEDFWAVWPTYVPDGLTIDKIKTYRKLGYIAYYLHPRYIMWRVRKDISSWKRLKSDFIELCSLFRTGHSTVSLTE